MTYPKKKEKWHYLNLCVEDMYTYESMFSDIQTGISVAYFAVGFFLSDELLIILGSWSWSYVDIITVFYLYFTALFILVFTRPPCSSTYHCHFLCIK